MLERGSIMPSQEGNDMAVFATISISDNEAQGTFQ